MNKMVYCRSTAHNVSSFYLRCDGRDYYLFSQNFKRIVHDYYSGGVTITSAIRPGRRDISETIYRTMDKIRKNVVYLEKEYDLEVFNKTIERNRRAA